MVRELHVAAVSEDGRHVLLATRKGVSRGEFRVALDDRLAAALRGELPRPGDQSAPAAVLSPKEIQARLRAGESSEQIAASAGVPVARVERFAGPVLSERERIINAARAAVLIRSRRGLSGLCLGDAVAQHLSETSGYRPETVSWTARREVSGRWLVQLSFVVRGKTRVAGWRYDPASRELTSLDTYSAALGHVEPTIGQRASGSAWPTLPSPPVTAKVKPRPARVPAARSVAAKAAKPAAAPGKRVAAQGAPADANTSPGRSVTRLAAPGRIPGRTVSPPGARKVAAAAESAAAQVAAAAQAAEAAQAGEAGHAAEARRMAEVAEVEKAAEAARAAEAERAAEVVRAAQAAEATRAAAAAEAARAAEASRAAEAQRVADAQQAAAAQQAGEADQAAAATQAARAAQVEAEARSGPPNLRVVRPPKGAEPARGADSGAEPATGPAATGEAPPAAPAQPPAQPSRRAPARRAAGSRASVPAWADVLLGIAPVGRSGETDQRQD